MRCLFFMKKTIDRGNNYSFAWNEFAKLKITNRTIMLMFAGNCISTKRIAALFVMNKQHMERLHAKRTQEQA